MPAPVAVVTGASRGAEMALKYGIKDSNGRQPRSYRETHQVEPRVQYPNIIR